MEGFGPPGEDEWQERDDHTVCSYCGSMSSEEFFRLVEDGAEVGPTDKSYKAYVKHDSIRFGKIYFQHLSDDDKRKFVEMYNNKTMKIGVPGHFYRLPFFMKIMTGVDAMEKSVKDKGE